jgi:hypothetical protein
MLVDDVASRTLLNRLEALAGGRADARSYVVAEGVLAIPKGVDRADSTSDLSSGAYGSPERMLLEAAGGCLMHARTLGAPYLLFMATLGSSPVCAYVSRRPPRGKGAPGSGTPGSGTPGPRVYIDSQVFCDERLFDGTVLAGEMVRGRAKGREAKPASPFARAGANADAPSADPEERWVFLVDDCLASRGVSLAARPFQERRAAAENAAGLALDQGDGWCTHLIRTKRFFASCEDGAREALDAMRGGLPYPCTGVLARSLGRRRKDILVAEAARGDHRAAAGGAKGAKTQGELHAPTERAPTELLTIVATGMPDVYVAVDERGRELGAGVSVPTIGLSQELRSAFSLTPPGEGVLWTCARGPGGVLVPLAGGRA